MTGRVQDLQVGARGLDHLAVGEMGVGVAVGVGLLPQRQVVRVQPDRGARAVGEFGGRVDVVVVGVGADDGGQPAVADRREDGVGVMGRVDDDDLVVVADDPDVVVDVPGAAVEAELP